MTPAERLIVNAMVVFVCEAAKGPEFRASIEAMRAGLDRLDRMAPSTIAGIVATAERLIAQVDSGAIIGADFKSYARLALADFFISRRDAALNDLA